ncbi:ATP-binding protein [Motilibacter deserti]|uniref:PAS domain S-box protein n=1 Tax=Motilibacter deserti TaxID=2714956 RepID=A0ABX0GZJ1_9ACTN|nr:PAS domain S-box protein [Motilibacter deserti]
MAGSERVLAQRAVAFAPEPASVRRARSAVSETLRAAGMDEDTVDTAALLVSELVTNAVVHARSEVGVTVTVAGPSVLVEVADHSPHLPVQRSYEDESATTGRGLGLVEVLATDSGVRQVEGHGKVVWFTLGPAGRFPGGLPAADGRADEASTGEGAEVPDLTVVLAELPVALYCTFQEHAAALLREYQLTVLDRGGPAGRAAADEAAAGGEALSLLSEASGEVFALRDTGRSAVDHSVPLPHAAVPRFAMLHHVLDEAVELAADGRLLAPPSQPEIRALRTWCLQEVLRQAEGASPIPWQLPDVRAVPTVRKRAEWDDSAVLASSQALVAADDANRILAVSEPAARLLGWEVADLVGQRLVCIIPPRLHELHIAGFVRFLLSGQRRILGKRVPLTALRHDGTEVEVYLTIEQQPAPPGRTVLVAAMEPIDPPV